MAADQVEEDQVAKTAREIMGALRIEDDREYRAAFRMASRFERSLIYKAIKATREQMETPGKEPRNVMAYFTAVIKRIDEDA